MVAEGPTTISIVKCTLPSDAGSDSEAIQLCGYGDCADMRATYRMAFLVRNVVVRLV
jgi:hypothetical protein